ncbi:MAG: type III PLP-dependent enzyme, partial [Sphaerochaetaceae bacterium]|nr:type III PLP-dependent enzyme [Sphaerochaetaceae bacterium]
MEQLGILSAAQWQKVLSIGRTEETPVQIILQDIIEDKYKELEQAFPFAKIYYAVKANPERE